jgi:ATP-dependent protease ClpP protease subunit
MNMLQWNAPTATSHAAKRTDRNKKRKVVMDEDDGDEFSGDLGGGLEALFKPHGSMYTMNNHIYFNDDITQQSTFQLSKELRHVARNMKMRSLALGTPIQPIYLHLSTNGGEISAAFSVVDCMKTLGVPVYSVVDGFVASAGTIISLAAEKRFIQPNAYMLIHQLSSGVWGKMDDIDEQVGNLKKLMDHITKFYLKHTSLTSKALQKILTTDVTWNAEESIEKGIADAIYTCNFN